MAVIINEFEVVVEPSEMPDQKSERTQAIGGGPENTLTPRDIYDIYRHKAERIVRLWAD